MFGTLIECDGTIFIKSNDKRCETKTPYKTNSYFLRMVFWKIFLIKNYNNQWDTMEQIPEKLTCKDTIEDSRSSVVGSEVYIVRFFFFLFFSLYNS